LEVVLREGQSEDEGKRLAAELFPKLGISQQSMLAEAYIDLLTRRAT
jgi:adenylate cyclase class IV